MKYQRKLGIWALTVVMLSSNLLAGQTLFAANVNSNTLALLDASKVLSLKFEDNVQDSSAKGNNGTISGVNYSYVPDVDGGKALKLSGSTFVDLGKSGTLQPADLTVSFWIKPNETMTGEQMLMWNKTSYYSDGWYLTSESDSKPLAISLGSSEANRQPYKVNITGSRNNFFPIDAWTHVAITYNNLTKAVKIYRNGILQTITIENPTGVSGADGVIKSDDTTSKSLGYNGPQYNGAYAKYSLDDYFVYSTAASYEAIVALYEDKSGTSFDYELVARSDAEAIVLPEKASSDIALPLIGKSESTISWVSSNVDVIDLLGGVQRPAAGESDASVILTANVSFGSKSVTRDFIVIVPAMKSSSDSLEAVPMADVTLTDSYYANAFKKEVDYLLSLEADRLLSAFRTTSGLNPKAAVYDGWENTEIRGHTLGHYLSAISTAYVNATGADKARLKERMDYIIDELAACQDANGNGYISAFPTSFLDKVENGQAVWVPWYTIHKILAGLVSAAEFGDNPKALQIAEKFGEYIYNRTATWNEAMKSRVLSVEYGGMNDSLYDLYSLTDNNHFLKAAEKFDEISLFNSLYNNVDILNGKHANTTIPKVIGALKRYTVLDESEIEEYYLQVAENFWEMVVKHHSYVTGGNSENEHFGHSDVLEAELTNVNDETCNVYNMLKLTRELYKITKDKKYADFYENAFTNSIISSQNPETGMTMYFQPMDTGYFKVFSSAFFHFWCCTGTGMENFAKLNDSIYFTSKDSVYVNQYLSSIVKLSDKNLVITQQSQLPNTGIGDAATGIVAFTINTTGPTNTTLRFRIPDWAKTTPRVKLNGAVSQDYAIEGGYLVFTKNWTDGTTITLDFPMEVIGFDLPDAKNTVAFKYGPIVLSAGLGTKDMQTQTHGVNVLKPNKDTSAKNFITILGHDIELWKENVAQNLVKTDGKLEFTLKGTDADDGILTFSPHFARYEDRYGIYFDLITADSLSYQQSLLAEKEAGRAEAASVSFVIVANDQYELAANRQTNQSTVGIYNGKSYRDALANGSFSYDMEVTPGVANYLFSTYYSGDAGRKFDIFIDDTKLVSESIENRIPGNFYNQTRKITQQLVESSRTKTVQESDKYGNPVQRTVHYVTVKFASSGGLVGGLFDIFRVITDYKTNPSLKSLTFTEGNLSQEFDPEVTEYTLTVPTATESITMNAQPMDEFGLVYYGEILINDKVTRNISLTGDSTEIVLTAKAEDHTTSKQYAIHIVKSDEAASNPLTISGAASVVSNQIFDVMVSLNMETADVFAKDLTFSYDPSKVEFVSAEALKPDFIIVDQSETLGKVRLLTVDLHPEKNTESPFSVLKLQFKAKEISEAQSSSITMSDIVFANGSGMESAISNPNPYLFEIIAGITKDALNDAVGAAQSLYDAAVEGTHTGQYPAGSKASLFAAIQDAKEVLNDSTASQAQINQAAERISTAVQLFRSLVNTQVLGDLNGDNVVRVGDLAILASHYGMTSSDPEWNKFNSADFNKDGKIDIEDIAAIARLILGE